MALYTGRILMRGGDEANFDPDKMMPREWAISTDKKIVRICFAPGVCIRMATYDAFEKDMEEVQKILENCQSIEEAVVLINTQVSQNADAVVEYTSQAKKYRDEAEQFRNEAQESAEMAEAIKSNDYTYALNKPKINNVELVGNKSLEDLGIEINSYVKKILTIAGIDLQDNITSSELKVALELDKVVNKYIGEQNVMFSTSRPRENINPGDALEETLGRIYSMFAALKDHSFNNPVTALTAIVQGYALDATVGKILNDKIEALPKIIFSTTEPSTVAENTIVMVYEE